MKILVAGWFSFARMGATAGDLLARDLICQWLERAGHAYDVALAAPFSGGIDWRSADPRCYSHVVFVCGPFGNGWPIPKFLVRFAGCKLVGINLSMIEPLEVWNPFDFLLERDSSARSRPDISFLADQGRVPVVGVVEVHPQREYRERSTHRVANDAIHRLISSQEMSVVPIDTRLDVNRVGLRTPAEIESLIARMDVVVTTRLHGMVLALKNSVPAIAIDPIAGGAKLRRQAETIGWPLVFTTDTVTHEALQRAFDYCLTKGARAEAAACCKRAMKKARDLHDKFMTALARGREMAES
jgi:Polysaccharide pyruvyl transferase